jgi:hypothetical protein
MFPKFFRKNKMRINHLYGEETGCRFQKDPTMKIKKDIDVYKSRNEQI